MRCDCQKGEISFFFLLWILVFKKANNFGSLSQVLRFGYLVISIDGNLTEDQWFFSHTSSPLIFPPGFCHKFSISLSYPSHIKGFSWSKYLRDTESLAVPSKCLNQRTTSSNQFQVHYLVKVLVKSENRSWYFLFSSYFVKRMPLF